MRILQNNPKNIIAAAASGSQGAADDGISREQVTEAHKEYPTGSDSKWIVSKTGDGDAAMTLFQSPSELHEPVDPDEERRLVRKIELIILPYLAVCYAFFYIDKTTLSYAALFGIQEDLHLHGTQYSWLSSIFYFGFLVRTLVVQINPQAVGNWCFCLGLPVVGVLAILKTKAARATYLLRDLEH